MRYGMEIVYVVYEFQWLNAFRLVVDWGTESSHADRIWLLLKLDDWWQSTVESNYGVKVFVYVR